ncbi:hypothetical protein LTR08_005832 [Meristemomyces frigidus]|nr:hypothetical protein LTR08_005832 [Meristemomyces frigidus]
MAEDDDFDIDPSIAKAMGFSGFGMQPGKKRKFDVNDGFVDPSVKKQATPPEGLSKGKGANDVPLGIRNGRETMAYGDSTSASDGGVAPKPKSAPGPSAPSELTGQARLQALRQGLKNERGDMAYFLPSFIEDPWKNLRPQ